MSCKSLFSQEMHEYTERPGQLLPVDSHNIIRHRYDVAVHLGAGKKVLEVGAGHGIGSEYIAQHALSYVAGEYSSENIQLIIEKEAHAKCVQMDAHNLPFGANSFDLVLALAMIYYLDLNSFVHEVKRVLNAGGILFFCTSNKDVPGFVSAPFTTAYYSIPELEKVLAAAGFNCEFFGAFPKFAKSSGVAKTKVAVRDVAKKIIKKIPLGKHIWLAMRNKSLGGLKELPREVDQIEVGGDWRENFVRLPNGVCNNQYRIIYCVAQLGEVQ